MCGIVEYSGKGDALPVTFESLRRPESRGYDSFAFAFLGAQLAVVKSLVENKYSTNIGVGNTEIPKLAKVVIEVPKNQETLIPQVLVIPLQLLSYYIAVMKGHGVDQPRNLTVSATVE